MRVLLLCCAFAALSLSACTDRGAGEAGAEAEAEAEMMAEPSIPDAVTAAPDVYSVLHEGERVRMLEMKLPAGATDGLHEHPDEAVFFITGSTLRVHPPEGDPVEMDVPDGAPLSHEAWAHTVENIGTKDLHAIIVELSEGAREGVGTVPEGMGAADVAPDFYSVLLEDERVRILEMKLPPGATDGEHVHPFEAVYFISGGKARISPHEGELMEVELPDGAVLTHDTWRHTVENIGDTEIHAVIVELKQAG